MQNSGDQVLAVYQMLVDDVMMLHDRKYVRGMLKKYGTSNVPIYGYLMDSGSHKSTKITTIRNNETVRVDILLQKFEPRFYEDEGSEEYCLEICVHKKLGNPEKLQEEFSIFLASGKHLNDFIIETIWPLIDEAAEKEEKKVQRLKNHSQKIPREQHPRYAFRARKNGEESD